jgi:hypothetical protein
MLTVIVGIVAYVAGCFSHKWAAAAFKKATGKDAQDLANKAKLKG